MPNAEFSSVQVFVLTNRITILGPYSDIVSILRWPHRIVVSRLYSY